MKRAEQDIGIFVSSNFHVSRRDAASVTDGNLMTVSRGVMARMRQLHTNPQRVESVTLRLKASHPTGPMQYGLPSGPPPQ
jgi:hypothetical protein